MLSSFRKLTKVVIWLVVVAFVGTIIFAWGMDITRSKAQRDIIGTINGNDVKYETYRGYYDQLYRAEQAQNEGDIDHAALRRIRYQAWDNLVTDYLLQNEMNKRKIYITDDELVGFLRFQPPAELRQVPAFQTDGVFDQEKYVQAMSDVSPQSMQFWAQVEAMYRPEYRKLKLQQEIISTVRVSEDEIQEHYLETSEKVRAEIINVPASKYTGQEPEVTEEELQAFYSIHREDYKVDERAALECIIFSKDPTEEDWERINLEAEDIKKQLDEGADFAELAQAYSEDASAKQGGDVGWFGKGEMVKEFEETAFSLKNDEISDPIRTQFGWHILQIMGRRTEGGKEQVNARHILLKIRTSNETLDAAFKTANNILNDISGSDLADAAAKNNTTVENTGLFTRNSSIPKIGYDKRVNEFAFENKVGTLSPVFETDAAIIVAKVSEHVPAGIASFEEAYEEVKRDYINDLALTMCSQEMDKIYADIESGMSFEKASKKAGYDVINSGEITRERSIPVIGRNPKVIGKIFSLDNPGDMSEPFAYENGWAIVKLIERQSADLSKYGEIRDSLQQVIMASKQQQVFNAWFTGLVEDSNIEDYLAEFFTSR